MTLVANARMYALTPQVAGAWRALFALVSERSGVPLNYIEHAAPAPLEDLWSRDDLGAVFMCGFPFASAAIRPHAIAAPIPAAPRYGGLPRYCTDLVVLADSGFTDFRQTFGTRIGWTVAHSQSGYRAVRHHLLTCAGEAPESLFAEWIGPLLTPRRVIEALLSGRIDVGPLDSYAHDLLRQHEPATAARLRTVDSTAMTPMPLLVASPGIPPDTAGRLRQAFVGLRHDPAAAPALVELSLAGFAGVDPADYAVLLGPADRPEAV